MTAHATPAKQPLLDVRGLATWFHTREGIIKAVDGVTFQLRPGEVLGLVGESGSGKSITAFSLMGLVDAPGKISAERLIFDGHDLLNLTPAEYRALRGRDMAMIFQDPLMTLNPTLCIETQMIEAIRAHERVSKAAARARAITTLGRVGIPSPAERMRAYPYQFSGGMRQRVAIAIALLNAPKLIIADEPTTALDVTIQGQIIHEVRKLCEESNTALIWITHDLAVVSGLADRLAVMYTGRIVEEGRTPEVVNTPRHPYTQGLIASVPSIATRGRRLVQIPGATPSLLHLPDGCPFRTRCPKATGQCRQAPPVKRFSDTHLAVCWHPGPPAP